MNVRVRFAPSPTGFLHIGNVRTAIFNYLFAKHHQGTFVLRIEDTDQVRSTAEAAERLIEILKWLGIEWQEGPDVGGDYGPYRQMERLPIYKEYAEKLIEAGKAYYCYLTDEELEKLREEHLKKNETNYTKLHRNLTPEQRQQYEDEGRQPVIRFKVPDEGMITFTDQIKGEVSIEATTLQDFVLLRSTGVPTYNYACVIDDALMKITHIIRGDDHLANSPKQLLLYQAYGFEQPYFAHLPMILGQDGSKLSKRDAEKYGYPIYLEQYHNRGYLPSAIINYLSLLSWSSASGDEILSTDRLIEEIDLVRVGKSAAKFDVDKLNWMNGQYLREIDLDELVSLAKPYLENETDGEQLKIVVESLQDRIEYLAQIEDYRLVFYGDTVSFENEDAKILAASENAQTIYQAFLKELDTVDELDEKRFKALMKTVQKSTGYKGKDLWMPIRVGLTGQTHGPQLGAIVTILGKETAQKRLQSILQM